MPGHTEHNHALIDEDAGVAITGDTVFGADHRGLPTGYFHHPPAVYSEAPGAAEENLARLLDYEFDVALVSHGSSVTQNAREKLDQYVNFPGRQRYVNRDS